MKYPKTIFLLGLICGMLLVHYAPRPEQQFGYVEVVSIYDGDTFFVDLPGVRPIFGKRIGVRIKGIDTPEIRADKDLSKEDQERVKEIARQAKMFLVEKLRSAKVVEIKNVERGKFFRISADVYVDGVDVAELLLKEGLAKEYDGTGKKPKWH